MLICVDKDSDDGFDMDNLNDYNMKPKSDMNLNIKSSNNNNVIHGKHKILIDSHDNDINIKNEKYVTFCNDNHERQRFIIVFAILLFALIVGILFGLYNGGFGIHIWYHAKSLTDIHEKIHD